MLDPDWRGYLFVSSSPWGSCMCIMLCSGPQRGLREAVTFFGHGQICDNVNGFDTARAQLPTVTTRMAPD